MAELDENALDVRGILLINVINYVKNKRGKDGVSELKRIVSEREGDKINMEEIKQYEWYPHRLFKNFIFSAAELFGKTPGDMAALLGEESARDVGFLKFFIKLTQNPEKIVKRSMDIWGQYHKIGKIDVVSVDKGKIVIHLLDYFGGPYVCNGLASNIEGFVKYTSKNPKVVETKCTSRGDPYCEFVITWDAK